MNVKLKKDTWVVIPKPNPQGKLKFFCLPFAGGTSTAFRDWADLLPPTFELCIIEIPGRGHRLSEPLMHRLPELVEAIAHGILPYLDKPFVMFGHSMGNLIGFELAHYLLVKYKKKPTHLFLSGRGAPHLPSREEPIHLLPETEFLEKIKEYNGTPAEVFEHKELMEMMIPIIRADFEVCETYQFEEKSTLDCPVTIFGGLKDSGANKQELEAWAKYTRGPFSVRMFPGDHFYIIPERTTLLQTMVRDINNHFPIGST